MPFTETHLKKRIYKALEPFTNCYHRKVSDRWHAGLPDLFVCFEGRCVWLELKILPNKLTPLQKKELQVIQGSGGLAFGLFAKPDMNAFYLYRNDFDIIEYGNLTDLLTDVLIKEAK